MSEPLGGDARYGRGEDCSAHPLASALFSVPGITEIEVKGEVLIVSKETDSPWEDVYERFSYAIAMNARPGEPEVTVSSAELDEDELFEAVEHLFETEINPTVATHGGKIELIDVQDTEVIVRMMGGCQGCGMANVTLRQGIESSLRRAWPQLSVVDITDHASGSDPYFTSEKK
ncbi:MAG: NifU family protein [Gemmatimonadetes bacterium]|nr:NifU family protein [Gemmatimonadota bacterium]